MINQSTNGASMSTLPDLLTAIKWDLKSGVRDGADMPEEMATNIARLDASIIQPREASLAHPEASQQMQWTYSPE